MQCSWKSVFFFAMASVAVQLLAIQTLTSYLVCTSHPNTRSVPFSAHHRSDYREEPNERRTHVLLLTSTRCGSSFIGQLLNQHPDVFYLFEPLYYVQAAITGNAFFDRRLIMGANRDLLWSLFQCDLHALESYMDPAPSNHMVDGLFFYGLSRTLCQPPVCQTSEPEQKEGQCSHQCNPVNLTRAAEACSTKSHVVYKTVRAVVVGELRSLLEDPRLNIKVIQLVRDPRGILSSRIEAFGEWYEPWGKWQATGQRPDPPFETKPPPFTDTCDEFYSSVSTALSRPDWLRDRYMLLRYEDLSRNPLQKTKEIYDFVGLTMTPSVEEWIRANTRATNDAQAKDKSGTMRDSAANAERWRLKLPMDMVQYVQGACQRTLRQLGYSEVQSADELTDMNVSLVEEKTFGPF